MSFCQQPNPPRVCAEFFVADAVLTGKVISVRYLPQGLPGHDPGWLYGLKVLRMYRGPAQAVVKVYTENNSARLPLEKNRTYLLFAYRADRILEIYGCGNSSGLSRAGAALKQIDEVLKHEESHSGGNIGGRVELAEGKVADMAGIRVTAQGGSGIYHALTDSSGQFAVQVPAGTYSLRAESSAWNVSPYDLSFNRPDNVVIHDGGCAELQFLATPK